MTWTNTTKHIHTNTRHRILKRDNHTCQHCGTTNAPMEVDHINNQRGPNYNTDTNLQTLCRTCHTKKTQHEAGHWRRKTKRPPRTNIGLA